MDKNNVNEALLAEIVEQNEKQQKDFADMKKSIEGISGEFAKLVKLLSPTLDPIDFVEMIPKKDADEQARFLLKNYYDMHAKYIKLKADYGELQAKTRYWASSQWTKRLFRWLFVKRHVCFFLVFLLYAAMMSVLIYTSMSKNDEISRLQDADLKYRFVRASQACPETANWVDSLFDVGNPNELRHVREVVNNYEKTIKQRCDSIMKAERKKQERY